MSDGLPNHATAPFLGAPGAAPRAPRLNRTEFEFNTWSHVVAPGVDWNAALSREYWLLNYERLRTGDSIIVHSFDHRIQFVARVLAINAAIDPVHLDMVFQAIYLADLDLPVLEAQRQPRFEIRQAAGSPLFETIDRATGRSVKDNPMHRQAALDLAAQLERAASQVEAEMQAGEPSPGDTTMAVAMLAARPARPKRGRPRKPAPRPPANSPPPMAAAPLE